MTIDNVAIVLKYQKSLFSTTMIYSTSCAMLSMLTVIQMLGIFILNCHEIVCQQNS